MSPRRKRAVHGRRIVHKASSIVTNDWSKLIVIVVGLLVEHKSSTDGRQASDTQNLAVAGSVAEQVAENRDSVAAYAQRLERLERLVKVQGRKFQSVERNERQLSGPVGPPAPEHKAGVVAGFEGFVAGFFGRGK